MQDVQDVEDAPETAAADEQPQDRWYFLPDPGWEPESEDDRPPPEVIVGGWYVTAEGMSGPFQGNPEYAPSSPESPTDPVDAAIRLAIEEDPPATEPVLNALPSVVLGIALDDDGNALVATLPDEGEAVLITTAPVNRGYIDVPGWREAMLWQIAESLPEGVDMIVNPESPVSMHLQRETVLDVGVRPEGFAPVGEEESSEPAGSEPAGSSSDDGSRGTPDAAAENRLGT